MENYLEKFYMVHLKVTSSHKNWLYTIYYDRSNKILGEKLIFMYLVGLIYYIVMQWKIKDKVGKIML